MVVVCDGSRVLGTLTDGDLRRALIKGARLNDPIAPHFNRDFVCVGPDVLRADVLEVMQARHVEAIPVVDAEHRLVGVHTLHSILGHQAKENCALIMAGGKGTRLGALTAKTPKPMLKVAGRPIIERILLHLLHHGIHQVYIAINHLGNVIEDYFGDGSSWGCKISYVREEQPMGSGGALSLIPQQRRDLLLLNGDILIEADLSRLISFHERGNYFATMGIHYYSHEIPFGCIDVDGDRIMAMEEKPLLTKTINGGVYVLSPEAVRNVPRETYYPVTRLFEQALDEGQPCGAYPLDGEWVDVGSPEQLLRARGALYTQV